MAAAFSTATGKIAGRRTGLGRPMIEAILPIGHRPCPPCRCARALLGLTAIRPLPSGIRLPPRPAFRQQPSGCSPRSAQYS